MRFDLPPQSAPREKILPETAPAAFYAPTRLPPTESGIVLQHSSFPGVGWMTADRMHAHLSCCHPGRRRSQFHEVGR